jgi:hypothetical protein
MSVSSADASVVRRVRDGCTRLAAFDSIDSRPFVSGWDGDARVMRIGDHRCTVTDISDAVVKDDEEIVVTVTPTSLAITSRHSPPRKRTS